MLVSVYEERSIGLKGDADAVDFKGEEERLQKQKSYVGRHMQDQLTYDVGWLLFATWLICIIERGNLTDQDNFAYFSVFAILFEVVSGYANCGLSLGSPYSFASFCGE